MKLSFYHDNRSEVHSYVLITLHDSIAMIKVFILKFLCFDMIRGTFCGGPIVPNLNEFRTNEIPCCVLAW